jgi:hypothetical protein
MLSLQSFLHFIFPRGLDKLARAGKRRRSNGFAADQAGKLALPAVFVEFTYISVCPPVLESLFN